MKKKARIISFYLPQFHPVKENDEWWGKGFTEWTNVTKAKPLFSGHIQPKFPTELGYYDLRLEEVREQQAELARTYGVESFCYWHYWFGNGKTILERPFQEVLKSKKPDMDFCLAWANITWGGLPYGDGFDRLLAEQVYPGEDDYRKHFEYVLPAFLDPRYSKVEGKPIFLLYNPKGLPDSNLFIRLWNSWAVENGLPGIHFIAIQHPGWPFQQQGFDAITFSSPSHLINRIPRTFADKVLKRLTGLNVAQAKAKFLKRPQLYDYSKIVEHNNYEHINYSYPFYPCVMPNWDHTPRSGIKGQVLLNPLPGLFLQMLKNAFVALKDRKPDERIIFVKAWNEWAEGNFLEPEKEFGLQYLEAIREFQES